MRKQALVLAAVLALVSCEDDDDPVAPTSVSYTAAMSGANERPAAITTNGTGTFTGVLNLSTNVLTYTVTWSGLSGASNAAHIHGPILATSGNAALPVLIDLNAPTAGRTITHGVSGSAGGSIDFKVAFNASISGDSLKKLFDTQKLYVNVHTALNGGGEILGIINKQ